MNCPKCGNDNPDDAQFCGSCNYPLNQPQSVKGKITVKTNGLAVASMVLGFLALAVFALLAPLSVRPFLSRSIPHVVGVLYLVGSISAFLLGVISLIRIELSGGRLVGRACAITGIGIPVITFLSMFISAALLRTRSVAFRMTCGTNLSGIGKAMLIYANDFDDEFPRAGGPGTRWTGRTPAWDARDRFTAFGLSKDGTGGTATISSSLYLLVKYAEVAPKSFKCNGDKYFKEFKLYDYQNRDANCRELIYAWDFGPNPAKHCSFSYYNPYGKYHLKSCDEPNIAIAAERNPWIDAPGHKAKDFARFVPDKPPYKGTLKQARHGNNWGHEGHGQNVLFLDSHVNFEKRSYCGIDDDNIYTYWAGEDKVRGTPPVVGSEPANKLDSLLVNDPSLPRRR